MIYLIAFLSAFFLNTAIQCMNNTNTPSKLHFLSKTLEKGLTIAPGKTISFAISEPLSQDKLLELDQQGLGEITTSADGTQALNLMPLCDFYSEDKKNLYKSLEANDQSTTLLKELLATTSNQNNYNRDRAWEISKQKLYAVEAKNIHSQMIRCYMYGFTAVLIGFGCYSAINYLLNTKLYFPIGKSLHLFYLPHQLSYTFPLFFTIPH